MSMMKIERKRTSKKYKNSTTDEVKSDRLGVKEETAPMQKDKTGPIRKSVTVKLPTKKLINSASVGEEDIAFKIMILGDSGTGKTCIILKFRDNVFLSGNYISTVGIDFKNKIVDVDGTKVKLQIWDTAGQERFRSVTHAYYRDAHALLLLYDVTSRSSFDNIRAWLTEIKEYAQDDVVIMLLGNKADCKNSERVVRKEEGEKLAKDNSVVFMETSAKTGQNVDIAFIAIAKQLLCKQSEEPNKSSFNVQDYIREQTQHTPCSCII